MLNQPCSMVTASSLLPTIDPYLLASIYQEDLAQFTSVAMQKAAMNNLIMNSLEMTDSDKRIFLNQTS